MAPVQVGMLMDGALPIPANATPILLEIGSSDRNTMDVEILPRLPDAFLVTAEPLIEKYSRALGRRRESRRVMDSLEPLGQHHDRGFILPFAVAPVPGNGELRDLNVGGNSGCASLLTPDRKRHRGGKSFGSWCDESGESDNSIKDSRSGARSVWTVPLRQMLEWIDRPVEFLKIDAQGMDLDIVTSGGSMLHLLQRVLLEVISDDCKPVYLNQPRCSEVIARMGSLGFKPLTPIPCEPRNLTRLRANHFCELEYVFINAAAGITAQSTRDEIFEHHNGFVNSCTGTYDILKLGHPHYASRNGKLRQLAGDGQLVAPHWHPHRHTNPEIWYYHDQPDVRLPEMPGSNSSMGRGYLCPNTCFVPAGPDNNRTHILGVEWATVFKDRLHCPF